MYMISSFSVTYVTEIASATMIFPFCQLSLAAALPPACAVASRVAVVAAAASHESTETVWPRAEGCPGLNTCRCHCS